MKFSLLLFSFLIYLINAKIELAIDATLESTMIQQTNATGGNYPFDLIPGPLYIFLIFGILIFGLILVGVVIGLQIMKDRANKRKKKIPKHDGIGMNLGLELDAEFEVGNDINSPVLYEPDDFQIKSKKSLNFSDI
jgi:hypothetical protein